VTRLARGVARGSWAVAGLVLAGACSGQVRGGAAGPGPATTGAAGMDTAGVAGAAAPPGGAAGAVAGTAGASGAGRPSDLLHLASGVPPTARLRRLTTVELANSVHDLLGVAAPLGPVETDTYVDRFATIGASTVATSPAGVGLYESATGAATDYVFSDAARASAALPCVPKATTDTACLARVLSTLGRRAFRRPLTDAEVTRLQTLAVTIGNQAGSSVLVGLRHAVWALLQSPTFLYRVELGAPSAADGGRLKYTSFEQASRLAATLWASVPDDPLLDAAAADALATPEGLRAQASRMLADPRAHRALAAFADQLYGARELGEATKDPTVFPAWTEGLRASMRTELELRVDDAVLGPKGTGATADFLSIYDSRTTFVDADLARYYGLPEVATPGFTRVELPAASPRAGLLGAGAILSAFALPQRTSPTARGKFINQALLCRTIPPPPPGVPPLPAMADATATLRQRLSAHRAAATCASCHALMDPLGFGMESFDGAGRYRTLDNGQAIDATGTLGGAAFNDLASLGAVLRAAAVAGPCVVAKLYANAVGRTPTDVDAAALDELAASFAASGHRADQLLVALVSSDAFRFVAPQP
jgi:hypothetical protein